jgi:hypothetical protein
MSNVKTTLGGVAVVVCVHDREKRQVTTIEQIQQLGRELDPPMIFNPKVHYVAKCMCCENLFVSLEDTPRFCSICQRDLVHPLGGPMPTPTEGVRV